MKNKIKVLLFIFLMFIPLNIFGEELKTYSNNVLVYNLDTNEILYFKNEKEKIQIASLTKIMTIIVSLENIKDLDELVKIPKIDYLYEYSRLGFKFDEEVTYRDLLYSAMLPSAADATESLAILISGSTDKFISLMNNKAKELNMSNTSFSNTFGKDSENNYSTIEDLLKLMKYSLNNTEFYKIFTTKTYKLTNGKTINSSISYYGKKENLDIANIIGAKTGYTDLAGYCMISIYKNKEANLLIITANADYKSGKPTQVLDGLNIGKYYNKNYKYYYVLKEGEYIGDINILGVKENIYSEKEIKLYLPNDTIIKTEYKSLNRISFNSKTGDKIGEYIIKYDDKRIVKDIRIPNTNKIKILLFLKKYTIVIYWLTRIFVFT